MITHSPDDRAVSAPPDQDWSAIFTSASRRRHLLDPETGLLTAVEPEDTWRLSVHAGHVGVGDVRVDLVHGLDERTEGDQ